MKGFKFLFAICIMFSALSSYAERYVIEVGQFEKLKINGNLRVVYKNLPDSTGFALYEAPEGNDFFKFTTKKDGNLKVEPSDENWGESNLPVLHLYSDFLTSIESYSELQVDVTSIAPCATFNVTQVGNGSIYVDNVRSNSVTAALTTGNGSIFINGKCINANFRMLGTGLISADMLEAENVKCRILGTGSIGCWPVDNLNVTGLGSTKIYYKGRPNIKKTGGGKLFELPEDLDYDAMKGVAVPSLNPPASSDTESSKIENSDEDEDNDDGEDDDEDNDDDDDDEEDNLQTVVTEND